MKLNNRLTMAQVQADLFAAEDALARVMQIPARKAKYIKGMAGYHLQQAAEKMIKIQIYASGMPLDYSKLYKHSLDDLMMYAGSLGISMIIPDYIRKYKTVISDWEAQGRYDVHFVVRVDQLKRCYKELMEWYDSLLAIGYK